LPESVAQYRERDVAQRREDDDKREEELERVQVVLVQMSIEPADQEIVRQGQDPSRADRIVGSDVGQDSDLGSDADIRGEELPEEGREGSTDEPESEGVEEELVAAVGVLLPAVQLVVDGERDAFFETVAGVGGKADGVAFDLQSEGHVEVL
jgi:hypothetical protein